MTKKPKILIVDDDPKILKLMRTVLERHAFEVTTCNDGVEAMAALDGNPADLIISDYMMPGMDGLELMKTLREKGGEIPFILVTGFGSIDSTMEAIKLGMVEYITKPFDPVKIVPVIRKALNLDPVDEDRSGLQKKTLIRYSFKNIIGQSTSMQEVYRMIHNAAQSSTNVLITGETGTGKELAARAIHYNGLYKKGPFIAVNCSAFSKGTLESELFGHVKGAFTDAHRDHKGRFELADGGTLFIDELGDIPMDIQVKLLRVIQEKRFEQVGGQETLQSDFRLIAATNRDLRLMVEKGLFREDLFYRLSVINIAMPPVREHPDDILLLIKHFLAHYNRTAKKEIQTLSLNAMKMMQSYSWPGNVRQLENAIESAVAMCEGNMIRGSDLPVGLIDPVHEETTAESFYQGSLPQAVADLEIRMIRNMLDRHDGVKARAAKALGISERVLSYKMEKYGITGRF